MSKQVRAAGGWVAVLVALSCSPAEQGPQDNVGDATQSGMGGGGANSGLVTSGSLASVGGTGGSSAVVGPVTGAASMGGAPSSSSNTGSPVTGGSGAGGSGAGSSGAGSSGAGSSGAGSSGAGSSGTGSSGGNGGVGGSGGGNGGVGGSSGAAAGGSDTGGTGGVAPAPTCPQRTSAVLSEALGPVGADGFSVWAKLASEIEATGIPTVGIVRWALEGVVPTQAHVEFGLDSNYGTKAPVNLACADFRTTLVGLKPERTYHYRIVASDGLSSHVSEDYTLLTGPALTEFPLPEMNAALPEQLDPGYFVGSLWTVGSNSDPLVWTAYILDSDGELVWWYTAEAASPGGELGLARVRLSADSQDVWLAQVRNAGAPLVRVSIDTLEAQTYGETVGSHDIAAVAGETMAYVDYSARDCTGFTEIDKDGTTRRVFDIEATLGLTSCHANSLQYAPDQDVYVLSIHQDDVVIVDREGQVSWRLSERVTGGNASWGGRQHGTQLLDDGILIFANETDQGSQVLEFALDGSLRRSIPAPNDFNFLGNAQRLANGNTLITARDAMTIVNPAGDVALEMTFVRPLGYLEFRPSLYENP